MSTKPGLQLPVLAMSLVVPVRAFHDQPGCVGEFLRKHVGHPSGLIAFSSMSGGDLQKVADGLEKYLGLAEGRDIAAIDGGPRSAEASGFPRSPRSRTDRRGRGVGFRKIRPGSREPSAR